MINSPPPIEIQPPVARLHPASFAMVMATGIISVAAQLEGFPRVARILVGLNVVLYAVLWGLTLWRAARYRQFFLADLLDHNRTVGFFTMVASTCVLGNQFVVVAKMPGPATGLWLWGILLWAVITYAVFTILTIKREKPSLADGLNGGWLVAVVAAQAVATLGGLVAPQLGPFREPALFFSLVMWLGGGMLYSWIIALIFYRYTFLPLDPAGLTPPYWINMGAMAISTLAGTVLIASEDWPMLPEIMPFVKGATLLFWATATWWIPLLIVLGIWRHGVRRVPLTYDVVYWSAVFPLGMYTACTHRLAAVFNQPWLAVVPGYLIYVALAAWGVTFVGLLVRLFRLFSPKPSR